jgi:hypothetical protein
LGTSSSRIAQREMDVAQQHFLRAPIVAASWMTPCREVEEILMPWHQPAVAQRPDPRVALLREYEAL